VAGLLVPVGLAILSVPSSLFSGHVHAQAVVFSVEIAIVALVAAPILLRQWLIVQRDGLKSLSRNVFLSVFGPVYLGVLAALWISAPPSAVPAAGLAYAVVCFALAGLWLVMALTVGARPSGNEAPQGPVSRAKTQA
jgi:hypothetical protein